MTHQERLAIVKASPKLKLLWYFVLIFLAINLVVVVYAIFMVLNTINTPTSTMTTSFLLLSLTPVIAITILQLWLLWGAYRLEGWITFWLWLAIVGTLMSFNIYALILNIAALVVYKIILKNIKKVVI